MSKKIIQFSSNARKSIQSGVNTVVKAVQTSYGPAGRTSIISQSYGGPTITNDGVTIAKAIELEGLEQMGVSLIQQAANKTNDVAGDATSSTVILSGAIINEGLRVVEAGSDPVKVRSGIQKAVQFSLVNLEKIATPITTREDKASVATISSRSSEIGAMIADILEKVGNDGVVTVQTGDSNKMEVELTQGMQFDKGYKSPYFVTDTAKMEAVVEKPMILVTDQKVTSIQDILPVIEQMAASGKKDLVLIADDIEGEALATFVLNKVRGIFNVYAVQAPAFGDRRKAILEDIAILVGATFISLDLGMQLKTVSFDDLGTASRVIITKDNTTIVDGGGDKNSVQNRANYIAESIKETKSDYEIEKLLERKAKLVGGVGVIKVGAATEVEMKELKYVVEDAVNATKAAIAEGVVPGGAVTFVRLSQELDQILEKADNNDEKIGIQVVQKALFAPFRAIAQNSGIYDISIILEKISQNSNSGYDFKEMKFVENMLTSGIVDPKIAIREAISNATSVGSSVLTTEVVICDEPKDDKSNPISGMGGMDY
jgi:chaperonin GroEL